MSLDSKFTRVWDTEKYKRKNTKNTWFWWVLVLCDRNTKICTKSALKENQFLLCIIHMIYVSNEFLSKSWVKQKANPKPFFSPFLWVRSFYKVWQGFIKCKRAALNFLECPKFCCCWLIIFCFGSWFCFKFYLQLWCIWVLSLRSYFEIVFENLENSLK